MPAPGIASMVSRPMTAPGIAVPAAVPAVPSYDTPLSVRDEAAYRAWAAQYPRGAQTSDYDMRGWWKEHGSVDPGAGHFEDKFKKPNHPTFSDESIYSGVGGNQGGRWTKLDGGKWSFTPGKTNLQTHGAAALQQYFQRVEPGNTLILDGGK
jgi:hypothetical protein